MSSPARTLLIIFAAACLIAGGGVLYIDIGNKPMVYYVGREGFNDEYAITVALIGAAYLGPIFFFVGLVLHGLGGMIVQGVPLLLRRK
jgi:hypothetical protein